MNIEKALNTAGRINKSGRCQKIAWNKRDQIKVGDAFLWHGELQFEDLHKKRKNYTVRSGDLPEGYISTDEFEADGDIVLKVCRVYEGVNGYGNYVDYWLNPSGKCVDNDRAKSGAIIINGFDAQKMERAK